MTSTLHLLVSNSLIAGISALDLTQIIISGLIVFVFSYMLISALDQQDLLKPCIAFLKKKWQMIKHGNAVLLVKDGVLQLDKLYNEQVTPQEIYSAIRSRQIHNLAEVERLFLLPDGQFSISVRQSADGSLPVYQYTGDFYEKHGEA